jgi:endoglycosylceramidase
MVDWGITLVRLGVMWESVEVAPREYNLTYLDEVDKLVNRMGERGIYTIVDAHQDLYSRMTCGEGMPTFYATDLDHTCLDNIPGAIFSIFGQCKSMETYGHRKDEKGLPNLDDCVKTSFIKYYTSPEVSSSFEGLYQNKYGIQDRFIEYWDLLSRKFTSNKYVIGYDPINEPWPANFYKDFSLFYKQTKFDKEFLFPLL